MAVMSPPGKKDCLPTSVANIQRPASMRGEQPAVSMPAKAGDTREDRKRQEAEERRRKRARDREKRTTIHAKSLRAARVESAESVSVGFAGGQVGNTLAPSTRRFRTR